VDYNFLHVFLSATGEKGRMAAMAATAAGTSVSRSAFFGTVATRNAVREKVAVGQAKVSMVGYLLHSLYMVSMVSIAWLGDVANMDLNFFCL